MTNYISINVEFNEHFQQTYSHITSISNTKPIDNDLYIELSDDELKSCREGNNYLIEFMFKFSKQIPSCIQLHKFTTEDEGLDYVTKQLSNGKYEEDFYNLSDLIEEYEENDD